MSSLYAELAEQGDGGEDKGVGFCLLALQVCCIVEYMRFLSDVALICWFLDDTKCAVEGEYAKSVEMIQKARKVDPDSEGRWMLCFLEVGFLRALRRYVVVFNRAWV